MAWMPILYLVAFAAIVQCHSSSSSSSYSHSHSHSHSSSSSHSHSHSHRRLPRCNLACPIQLFAYEEDDPFRVEQVEDHTCRKPFPGAVGSWAYIGQRVKVACDDEEELFIYGIGDAGDNIAETFLPHTLVCGRKGWLFNGQPVQHFYCEGENRHQTVDKLPVWDDVLGPVLYFGHAKSVRNHGNSTRFYLCWGCLVFLPCIYTSHTQFLVEHSTDLGPVWSFILLAVGCTCIYINYDVDNQRQTFRKLDGQCKIWGKDPFFIEAKYKTEKADVKTSLLLGSGWWQMARHFHYLPEIGAAVCWTVPVYSNHVLPYFYVPYLVLLLVDRAYRDDARCRAKYGAYWEKYCKHVPSLIVPGIF